MVRTILILVCAAASSVSLHGAAEHVQGSVRWFVRLANADYAGARPGTYRLYEEPDVLVLRLSLANVDAEALAVDVSTLEQRVDIAASSGDTIQVTWELLPEVRLQDGTSMPVAPAEPVLVRAGETVDFSIAVRRLDGQVFHRARYAFVVSTDLSGIVTAAGYPWRGKAPFNRTAVYAEVGLPTASEFPAALRQRARKSEAERRLQDAVSEYKAAVKLAPERGDLLVDLSKALLSSREFKEAVYWLQRAQQLRPSNAELISLMLAYAYVGTGSEQDAASALRAASFDERFIETHIRRLRALVSSGK